MDHAGAGGRIPASAAATAIRTRRAWPTRRAAGNWVRAATLPILGGAIGLHPPCFCCAATLHRRGDRPVDLRVFAVLGGRFGLHQAGQAGADLVPSDLVEAGGEANGTGAPPALRGKRRHSRAKSGMSITRRRTARSRLWGGSRPEGCNVAPRFAAGLSTTAVMRPASPAPRQHRLVAIVRRRALLGPPR